MRIESLRLINYRGFADASFDLRGARDTNRAPLTVLVGENGSGKTSVLAALASFFSASGLYQGNPFVVTDIRDGAAECAVKASWHELGFDALRLFQPMAGNPDHIRFTDAVRVRSGTAGPELSWQTFDVTRRWTQFVQTERAALGVFVAFDVFRLLQVPAIQGPNVRLVPKRHFENAALPTIDSNGNLRPRFGNLPQWLVNLDFQRAKSQADFGRPLMLWDNVIAVLNNLLEPFTFHRVDESFNVLFKAPTGTVPLPALSDGLRSVFVIVTELLFRLSLATPEFDRMAQVPAVCLVDEIDAHLHPKWQERIIGSLRTIFPQVQFIVTTHSPYVLASVEPEEVVRIDLSQEAQP